jgi:hypothetical protein
VLPIEEIANLPPHHAVVVSSHLRPRIAHLPPWRGNRTLARLAKAEATAPTGASPHGG